MPSSADRMSPKRSGPSSSTLITIAAPSMVTLR